MLEKKRDLVAIEMDATNGVVFARYRDSILEDGQPIGTVTLHSQSFSPGDDVSEQSEQIRKFCEVAWSEGVVEAYRALLSAPAA